MRAKTENSKRRAEEDRRHTSQKTPIPPPTARRLRVYAFDPSASLDRGSAKFNQATISLVWNDLTEGPLDVGPVNDYLEVIDVDPVSRQFYEPVNLNDIELLAQDGLPPSEGDPRFHQQMVFAVAMKTIKLFERALGRRVIWASAWDDKLKTYVATKRLRVYPHALREANAYYSREKRALLFGYFKASQRSAGASWVFTALSHDIIVHETTHAILDGLHPRYAEPTSVDSLAFHEAFADIAALFSHFQLREAVYDYIDRQHGRLDQSGLLSGLASQFAKGTTGRAALRDYIDQKPDPDLLASSDEAHERGGILVAAVFDAFLTIYSARTEDLLRISGNARSDEALRLHPDLVARLTKEATKTADHVLRMCIRALDYLPPVDVRFGEFLRAIITADTDLIPDDRLNYRLAFVEAFRRRGIFPENCLSMSPDNLLWNTAPTDKDKNGKEILRVDDVEGNGLDLVPRYRRDEVIAVSENNRRAIWYWLAQPELELKPINGAASEEDQARFITLLSRLRTGFADEQKMGDLQRTAFIASVENDLLWLGIAAKKIMTLQRALAKAGSHFDRWQLMFNMLEDAPYVQRAPKIDRLWEQALGIYFELPRGTKLRTIRGNRGYPSVQVSSVRTTRRAGPDGQDIRQLVIEVAQRRQGFLSQDEQQKYDVNRSRSSPPTGDFVFRGGATLIIDLRDRKLRYVISKRIDDEKRLAEQRDFLLSPASMGFTYDRGRANEPFALLHRN